MSDRKAGSASHRTIEDNLRRVYEETLAEDVPDRFKDLLSRLKTEGAKPRDSDNGATEKGSDATTDRSN